MSSPITKWEGAAEYFTFADSHTAIVGLLIASAAVTVLALIAGAIHEVDAYKAVNGKK